MLDPIRCHIPVQPAWAEVPIKLELIIINSLLPTSLPSSPTTISWFTHADVKKKLKTFLNSLSFLGEDVITKEILECRIEKKTHKKLKV